MLLPAQQPRGNDAISDHTWAALQGMCVPRFLVLLFACALLMLAPRSVQAQVLYGTITGAVSDPTGASLPGAKVTVQNLNTGVMTSTIVNGAGDYAASNLTPGTYAVTVTAPGFSSFRQAAAVVAANQILRVNATLAVGEATQTISVTAAPPALQTEEASANYNISTEQTANLPTTSSTGRNIQSLYKLLPGSTPPYEGNSQAANPQRSQPINVNGQTYDTNTQRLDGAVDQNPWLPDLVAYLPPPDAIESIDTQTASFNAEQGSAGGAAINYTIRTGTNKFHGAAWGYNSIAQFKAHQWQNRATTTPKSIYNEDGFALGGPILKNKLFFFGDFNRVTTRNALSGIYSVPTAAMKSGDFSGAGTTIYDPATGDANGNGKQPFPNNQIPADRIGTAAKTLLAAEPDPNLSGLVNNWSGSGVNAFNRNSTDVKINYNPTDSTTFFGRYSFSPNNILDPQIFGPNPGGTTFDGGQPGSATGRIQNAGLGATHAFSPHFAIDLNGGFTRMRIGAAASDESLGDYGASSLGIPGTNYNGQPLYAGIPGFTFTTYTGLGNTNTSSPFLFRDMVYTGAANATYTRGQHSIRFGGEYVHNQINHFQAGSATAVSSNPRGSFTFSGGVTTQAGGNANNINSIADFLLGQATTYNKSVQVANPLTLRFSSFALYIQDTWQVSHKLTLNYGLRYEYYPLPVSDHYGTVLYDPSVPTTVTDSYGTHTVGTVLIGGKNGIPYHADITNGWGMFVPRFGLNYRIDDKTVIRSGFGITVDPNSLRSVLNQYPGAIATFVSGSNSYITATSLSSTLQSTTTTVGIPAMALPDINQGRVPLPATISTFAIPKSFRRGYIESYNLAVQRQFAGSMVATVAYVGAGAIRQQTYLNTNASGAGQGSTTGRELNLQYGAYTSLTDITTSQPFRGSNYNALQAQLSRTGSKYADFGVVYTYSKAMNAEDQTQSGLTFNYPAYWDRNWAVASTDRKHNFQWWTSDRLPFGKGMHYVQSGVGAWILGGWQLNTLLSRESGTPFNVTASGSTLNSAGNTQMADRVVGVKAVLGQNTNGYRQYLNPAAFAPVNAVRLGTAGRDSVRGPGVFDLDCGLKREFPLHENYKLAFQAESFNLTNTPAFSNPSANISNGGFGVITAAGNGRSLRLSARFEF
jgi:hypothetical protein